MHYKKKGGAIRAPLNYSSAPKIRKMTQMPISSLPPMIALTQGIKFTEVSSSLSSINIYHIYHLQPQGLNPPPPSNRLQVAASTKQ